MRLQDLTRRRCLAAAAFALCAGAPALAQTYPAKPINMVEILVDLKPLSEWRPNVTKEALIARMEKTLDDMPGIQPSFSQPIRDNVLESISQIDGQIVIKIFGDDSSVLKQKIEEVLQLREGTVVPLDKLAGDPVDILVNGRLIARGEVLVLNDNFCVRVNEIVAGVKDEGQ